METLERLRGLVKEVVELCENTEKEAKQITDKAEENKEKTYFDFCTELEPYRALVKEIEMSVEVDTGLSEYAENGDIYKYRICFYLTGSVNLQSNKYNAGRIAYEKGDFYAYHSLESGVRDKAYMIASKINWDRFEANFAEAIEEKLTERVAKANEKKKKAEEYLATTVS